MLEASYASAECQDLLVDILQKDNELMQMYEPRIQIYHESEPLNLLNIEVHPKVFADGKCTKWLNESLSTDHFKTFEKIVMEHVDANTINRIIFTKISFELISKKGNKYLHVIEQKKNYPNGK
eukprot:201894_1